MATIEMETTPKAIATSTTIVGRKRQRPGVLASSSFSSSSSTTSAGRRSRKSSHVARANLKRKFGTVAAVFWIASSWMMDSSDRAFLFRMGVSAEEPPTEVNVTPTPTSFPEAAPAANGGPLYPTIANIFPTPTEAPASTPTRAPVTIRKEAVGVSFDMMLDYTGTANFNQVTKDIDGALEDYIFANLGFLEQQQEGIDLRDVVLGVMVAARRQLQPGAADEESPPPLLRRWLQAPSFELRGLVVRVDGNVIYDIEADGCVECVDQDIETELNQLLTADALDEAIRTAQIEGVNGVTGVRGVTINEAGDDSIDRSQSANGAQVSEEDGLERPSTLSIAFGFALTAIAAMGLCFYGYLFYKKRRKRLRKQRQQRQSIEYRMPSSRVTPTTSTNNNNIMMASKQSPIPPPPAPTSASTPPIADDRSEDSSIKGLENDVSEDEPSDSFAEELQMAASRDQQAWANFQRKKKALDDDREIRRNNSGPMGSASAAAPPIISPPQATPSINGQPSAAEPWQKSFPYGDEAPGALQDQGVEWTDEDFGIEEKQWEPYNSNMTLHQPEEKKEDPVPTRNSRGARDPEPAIPLSGDNSAAILQSIEQTLEQFGSSQDDEFEPDDPDDVVDEVARLSRFVRRYEKRKERRHHRTNTNTSSPAQQSSPPPNTYSRQPSSTVPQRSIPPKQNENNGYLNNMRPTTATNLHSQDRRGQGDGGAGYNNTLGGNPPKKFMGITMTGGMYQDESLQEFNHPARSMSDDDDSADDSYRYADETAKNQRLGITPFSVQRPKNSPLYSENIAAPTTNIVKNYDREQPSTTVNNRKSYPMDQNRVEQRPRTKSEGEAFQSQRARLQDLRKSEAIIDSSRSEINVGNYPNPGEPSRSQMPTQRKIPQSNHNNNMATKNPKFSTLRNLFEERPKNAIFPPDEHWQSGNLIKR